MPRNLERIPLCTSETGPGDNQYDTAPFEPPGRHGALPTPGAMWHTQEPSRLAQRGRDLPAQRALHHLDVSLQERDLLLERRDLLVLRPAVQHAHGPRPQKAIEHLRVRIDRRTNAGDLRRIPPGQDKPETTPQPAVERFVTPHMSGKKVEVDVTHIRKRGEVDRLDPGTDALVHDVVDQDDCAADRRRAEDILDVAPGTLG